MRFLGPRRVTYAEGYFPEERTIKRLRRAGTRDGARGFDKQRSPCVTEREVAAEYDAAAQFEARVAQTSIIEGIDGALRAEPLPSEAEVRSVQSACTAQLKRIATEIRAKLTEQWNEVVETRTRLEQFKVNAGVDGKAEYPESKISHYGSLFLIGLGEAAANSWFYGSASPDGLGAGLLQAAVVSTVLVGSGAMAGSFAFRSCFSPNRIRRAFGLVGMGIYAAFALFISMAAASFRDALANDINLDGLMLPVGEILVSPSGLSFEAITLLAFAVMASGLAVYKGFTSDAAVPGHGLLDRRYRQALEAYKATWSGAAEKVTAGRETVEERFEALQESAQKSLEKREASLAEAKSAITAYETTTALLTSGFNYAIKVYRDAVDAIEPEAPWPREAELTIPALEITGLDDAAIALVEVRERLDQIRSSIADARHALNEVAASVQVELETFRARLEATHTPGTPADSPKLRVVADQMI